MIASLSGIVQGKAASGIVLGVSGVGYLVSVPASLNAKVSSGDELMVHTALIVREDAFSLFGFETPEQLSLFDLLRSVTGVGPKLALAILSTLTVDQISSAVATEDSAPFQSVPGVGAKTAKLISVTLAGKLKPPANGTQNNEDAILESLKSLGWSERVALPALRKASQEHPGAEVAVLIRAALVELSKN